MYRRLLQAVQESVPGLETTNLMWDFEQAMIGAVGIVFPRSVITDCFFHVSQSIWGKLQSFGGEVINRYREDTEFYLECRLLPALAFVSIDDVRTVFEGIAI